MGRRLGHPGGGGAPTEGEEGAAWESSTSSMAVDSRVIRPERKYSEHGVLVVNGVHCFVDRNIEHARLQW